MHVLEAGDWSLLLPPEWQAEDDGESIVIGDRDDVGCLEISELHKEDGEFGATDLAELTAESQPWIPLHCGSFTGLVSGLIEEEVAIREWYLTAGDLLLYITYSCELENRGMDDSAVDEILDTLRYAKA
ncbi:MAG: hypothetical protein AB8B57_13920 [Congregibacter sp.]